MNEELKSILKINVRDKEIPVNHLIYKGKEKTYITWAIISEAPSLSGDDEDLYSVTSVDIHIYSDGNYLDIVKEIKKIMKKNDWVWVEDSQELYEYETDLYHKVITFEKERFIDNG